MSNLLKNYLLVVYIFFIITNVFVENLLVSGYSYYTFMITLNIFNVVMIIKYNNVFKFKNLLYILFLIGIIFSKNVFYIVLLLDTFILLSFLNFKKSTPIKIMTIMTSIIIIVNAPVILFVTMMVSSNGGGIYPDTHYYCNNYEIYSHSAGATDSFHYTVIKHSDLLELNNVLKISYNERVGNTLDEYNIILNNNECRLVGV